MHKNLCMPRYHGSAATAAMRMLRTDACMLGHSSASSASVSLRRSAPAKGASASEKAPKPWSFSHSPGCGRPRRHRARRCVAQHRRRLYEQRHFDGLHELNQVLRFHQPEVGDARHGQLVHQRGLVLGQPVVVQPGCDGLQQPFVFRRSRDRSRVFRRFTLRRNRRRNCSRLRLRCGQRRRGSSRSSRSSRSGSLLRSHRLGALFHARGKAQARQDIFWCGVVGSSFP